MPLKPKPSLGGPDLASAIRAVAKYIDTLTTTYQIETWNGYRQIHVEPGKEGFWLCVIRIENCPMIVESADDPATAMLMALKRAATVVPSFRVVKPKLLKRKVLGKKS